MSSAGRYPTGEPAARLFVGVRLPEEVRTRIGVATRALRELSGVRWARVEQYHLTLRFLGDVAEGRVSDVADRLLEGTRGLPAFELEMEGAGAFPSARRARVVWAGVRPTEPLRALHAEVEEALAEFVERDPRPFRPHVTLGRVRGSAPPGLADAIREVRLEASCPISRIHLMQSRLGPGGARHSVRATAELVAD